MIILNLICLLALLLVLFLLFLAVCGLVVNPNKEYENHSSFYRALVNMISFIIIKVMRIKIHASGVDKVPKGTKKILFVGNHRSNFDPILTWYVLKPWQLSFISKPSNFKIPIFGRYVQKCCFMAIDRENPRNAMKTIIKASKLLQKGEVSVGVYPEGTRSKECRLLPFHNGVFKIAQRADAPIAIVAISGTEKVSKNYPLHKTDVYVDVLDVLPAEWVKTAQTDDIGELVKDKLYKHLSEK